MYSALLFTITGGRTDRFMLFLRYYLRHVSVQWGISLEGKSHDTDLKE